MILKAYRPIKILVHSFVYFPDVLNLECLRLDFEINEREAVLAQVVALLLRLALGGQRRRGLSTFSYALFLFEHPLGRLGRRKRRR